MGREETPPTMLCAFGILEQVHARPSPKPILAETAKPRVSARGRSCGSPPAWGSPPLPDQPHSWTPSLGAEHVSGAAGQGGTLTVMTSRMLSRLWTLSPARTSFTTTSVPSCVGGAEQSGPPAEGPGNPGQLAVWSGRGHALTDWQGSQVTSSNTENRKRGNKQEGGVKRPRQPARCPGPGPGRPRRPEPALHKSAVRRWPRREAAAPCRCCRRASSFGRIFPLDRKRMETCTAGDTWPCGCHGGRCTHLDDGACCTPGPRAPAWTEHCQCGALWTLQGKVSAAPEHRAGTVMARCSGEGRQPIQCGGCRVCLFPQRTKN